MFLDVVESVNLLVSASGTVLHSDIVGSVQMRVYLTGVLLPGGSAGGGRGALAVSSRV